jgi:putative peptide zinc metalloprotease protein
MNARTVARGTADPALRATAQLQPDTRLTLHPLLMREEGDGWIVGRRETGQFVQVPTEAATLVRALGQGASISEAAHQVLDVHGTKVDGLSFARQLIALGFVHLADGKPCEDTATPVSLRWLRPKHVRWAYSWPVYLVIGAFVLWNVSVALSQGDLIPGYHALFITGWQGFNVAWGTTLVMAAMAAHELAHLTAARSEDVPAKISIGTRLVFLCAQTTVSGLWGASRRARLRVYVAGTVMDLVTISCCLLALRTGDLTGFPLRSLQALILGLWLAVATQFAVYVRTDGYFVLQELLRCKNLYHDASQYLGYLAVRIVLRQTTRPDPTVGLPVHERRPVKIYSILMLVSTGVTLALVVWYAAPALVTLFTRSFSEVLHGAAADRPLQVADGAAALAVEGTLQVIFVKAFLARHKSRIARAAAFGAHILNLSR